MGHNHQKVMLPKEKKPQSHAGYTFSAIVDGPPHPTVKRQTLRVLPVCAPCRSSLPAHSDGDRLLVLCWLIRYEHSKRRRNVPNQNLISVLRCRCS